MTIVVAALTGSAGALARYLVSGLIQERTRSAMPVGTAAVNVAGALALGLVVGAGDLAAGWSVAGVGFLGGFTTFSTWMVETARLGVVPRPSPRAVMNLVGTAVLGIACVSLGYHATN
jgi:CrcB protein